MNEFELSAILDATVRLTELRQNECKHLSIENASAEIFKSLIMAYGEYQECLERSKGFLINEPISNTKPTL